MSSQQTPSTQRGIVKQVLSGDAIIIRDQPRGGPPPEKQINFSGINAPKLARRVPSQQELADAVDQPYAWEAREFLRKKLIGKEVFVVIETKVNNREYGTVYLGKDDKGENMTQALLAEGLATLRPNAMSSPELSAAQEAAKTAGKGIHGPPEEVAQHVRKVTWTVESPRALVEQFAGKPIPAIIEHVRDGSTIRAFLLPDFYYITLMLSGIRCPAVKMNEESTSDPFGEEAKFFTESRLLQRDVEIVLESTTNANFVGTVLHPAGNIAEHLLKEGFARCVDWSITNCTGGPEKLRAAERLAREKKLRIWQNYTPSSPAISANEREFTAKVIEIVNADSLMVRLPDDSVRKIFLSSIRPPRLVDDKSAAGKPPSAQPVRSPYEIPFMYEAREFLRKKLIGKKVSVTLDFIQPADKNFPQKDCCTVMLGATNVAENLVSKGLATVVRYRQDDDKRSSRYDELMAAEMKAIKAGVGMHTKKEHSYKKIISLSGNLAQCKTYLSSMQRAGLQDAVVEFVSSGSRFRLLLPKESCVVTFLLAGITCPRSSSIVTKQDGEPFGDEALKFSKELVHQREVQVIIETMDKRGGYIGWMFYEGGNNLSVSLVREGLAEVHFSANKSKYASQLNEAQELAMKEKKNYWATYEPVKEVEEIIDNNEERKLNFRNVQVSEVLPDLSFYAQFEEDGNRLEDLQAAMRAELTQKPPIPGNYNPRPNDLCAAIFESDKQWYRAKVNKVTSGTALVTFIDYGNKDRVPTSQLAALPEAYTKLPAIAHLYSLACIKVPKDEDQQEEARQAFIEETESRLLRLNVEYKSGNIEYVTLFRGEEDIGRMLVAEGFLMVEPRREKRLAALVADYQQAEESARKNRRNIWVHGDFTEDDAAEFGYNLY